MTDSSAPCSPAVSRILQNLFEKIGANQTLEDFVPIDFVGRRLESLRDPAPPFWLRQVHEIGTDGSAVDAACFLGGFSGERIQFGLLQRFEQPKRIERGFQIAPAAESVEDAFELFVTDAFPEAACRGFLGRLRKFCGALFF